MWAQGPSQGLDVFRMWDKAGVLTVGKIPRESQPNEKGRWPDLSDGEHPGQQVPKQIRKPEKETRENQAIRGE